MTNAAPWTCDPKRGFQHRLSWSSPHEPSLHNCVLSGSNKLHRLRFSPPGHIPIVSDRPAGPFGVLFGLLLTSVTLLLGRSPSCTLRAQLWAASRIRLPPPVFSSHLHWQPPGDARNPFFYQCSLYTQALMPRSVLVRRSPGAGLTSTCKVYSLAGLTVVSTSPTRAGYRRRGNSNQNVDPGTDGLL